MRSLRVVLVLVLLLPSAAQALELCEGRPRSIEPDMQIQEADLSSVAAHRAATELRDLLREKSSEHETHLGILNRLQVLEGFALRQRALEERALAESRRRKRKPRLMHSALGWTNGPFGMTSTQMASNNSFKGMPLRGTP